MKQVNETEVKKGFNQIEYGGFKDEQGHPLEMNQGYIEVKETFKEIRDKMAFLKSCVLCGESLNEQDEKELRELFDKTRDMI